jgi:hypothetical protein
MLEANISIKPESVARVRADDLLMCLTSVLARQKKLLEHPLSSADLYLYDWQAQQIRDLMGALEGNERMEARKSVCAACPAGESPAPETVRERLEQHERQKQLLPNYLAQLAISAWETISGMLLKIRRLLSARRRKSPAEALRETIE